MRILATCSLTLTLLACSKDDSADPKAAPSPAPVPSTAQPPTTGAAPAGAGAAAATQPPTAPAADLPPPPPEAFEGKTRLVNLLVDASGQAPTVDVWAKPSFTHGAVKLAEGIAPGAASDWFGVPKGQSTTVVPTGAGPDAPSLGGLFAPKPDEQTSHVLTLAESGAPSVGLTGYKAAKPAAGKALVVLEAGAFSGHKERFKELLGSWGHTFKVGDGKACREGEQKGMMLGGTSYVPYVVAPGKTTFALHRGDDYTCEKPPVYSFEVDAAADQGTLVHVYTPDAKAIAHLVLPIAF